MFGGRIIFDYCLICEFEVELGFYVMMGNWNIVFDFWIIMLMFDSMDGCVFEY